MSYSVCVCVCGVCVCVCVCVRACMYAFSSLHFLVAQDLLLWVNSALMRGSQEPVTNVESAMADGITLAKLAGVLST